MNRLIDISICVTVVTLLFMPHHCEEKIPVLVIVPLWKDKLHICFNSVCKETCVVVCCYMKINGLPIVLQRVKKILRLVSCFMIN